MECNRDEALRSKLLSESKFLERDYVRAKKFADKAKQLYPDLEGITHLIYVLDVHIVALDKLQTGENDWYGILEVDPSADENTIRKQYRRLALLLHPDKNKAVGAEAAFKYISEAWTMLSDKNKKAAYDARCEGKMRRQPPQQYSAPRTARKPGAPNTTASVPPFRSHGQAEQTHPPPPCPAPATPPSSPKHFPSPASAQPMPNRMSFWTSCPSCRMLLEYQRVYLLKNLCCPVCLKPFTAVEVSAVSGTLLWPLPPKQQGFRANTFRNGFMPTMGPNCGFSAPHFESFPFVNAKMGHSAHAPTTNMGQQEMQAKAEHGFAIPQKLPPELVQRVEERIIDAQAQPNRQFSKTSLRPKQKVTKKSRKEDLKAKGAADAKDATKSSLANSEGVIEQRLFVEKERKIKADSVDMSKANANPAETNVSSGLNNNAKSVGDSEAKLDDAGKNQNFTEGSPIPSSQNSPEGKRSATTLQKDEYDIFLSCKKAKRDANSILNSNELNGIENTVQASKSLETAWQRSSVRSNSSTKGSCQTSSSVKENAVFAATTLDSDVPLVVKDTISVPDSEFYDFDKDRTEGHILPGQVWAAYDDDDSMPRYYARVNKIITSQPFKIQIAWLEARSTSDETLAWLDSGFSLTCGEFRVGKTISSDRVNMFSHMMKFEKGQRGGFRIYPQQGDIWALYKNWENLTATDAKARFIVVVVLKGFHEEKGVEVCHLEKRDGYKTLFQQQMREERREWICTANIRRFSHQIPAYHLTSDKQPGITESIWELDPASTPLDFIY